MTNELINSCSTSLIIRGMQIKTTMRYHYIVIRMAIIKKRKTERKHSNRKLALSRMQTNWNLCVFSVRMQNDAAIAENSMVVS